jgi:putative intracellular protease/amidase
MKRIILMLILVSFISSFKKETPKVLLYIEDNSMDLGYMLTHEVGKMREILKQSGFEVIIATISGETLKADSISVTPDIKLSIVNVNDYSGFILPCMAPADTIVTPEEKSFVRKVVNEGKPIAAQTAAVLILAKAGVLNGKKYSFPKNNMISPDMYPEFKSGIYGGNSVIQDGNIITCGVCPMEAKVTGAQDGTAGLTQKLILEMDAKSQKGS